MLRQEDIAELVKRNIETLEEEFGGEVHDSCQLFIDIEKVPNITEQCIYKKVDESRIFNGREYLDVARIRVVKRMLLQETTQGNRREFRVSKDRGVHNLVLFLKPVMDQQEMHRIQEQERLAQCNEARKKALFLLDFNVDRTRDSHKELVNLLSHICNYASGFASQESGDMQELCALYALLKSGSHVGAFEVLATDFIKDPQQRLKFLQAICENLDPRMLYQGRNAERSWFSTKSRKFDDILEELRKTTHHQRRENLSKLQDHIERISNVQHVDQRQSQLNQALANTFKLNLVDVKRQIDNAHKLKRGLGTDADKLREIINAHLILNFVEDNQEFDMPSRLDSLANHDLEAVLKQFASKEERKEWAGEPDIYDLI